MREVVIQIHCDTCGQSLQEEDAYAITLTAGSEMYEGDLCEQDFRSWVNKMRPTTKKRRSPAKAGTVGPHACDLCEKRFTKPAGLTRHINQTHRVL